MAMRVKEVADLVGISVRTLHHYDEIGLLTPQEITDSGYRLYSDNNLELLQQILFFRELDLPLKKIKNIINEESFDRQAALQLHRKLLLQKRERLDLMISTIDKTIQSMKGEITMSNKDKFVGFDFSQNPYEKEARELWGDQAVDDSKKKVEGMTQDEKQSMSDEMTSIYTKLASIRHTSPQSEEAQAAIKEWYDLLNRIGSYSIEAFKGLGQMYVDDERFTNSIDIFGVGLAQFMRDTMAIYADNNQ